MKPRGTLGLHRVGEVEDWQVTVRDSIMCEGRGVFSKAPVEGETYIRRLAATEAGIRVASIFELLGLGLRETLIITHI